MATKYIVNNATGQTINTGIVISGETTLLTTPPISITGTTGDTQGQLAFDGDYLYYCAENFGEGSGDIWRTAKLDVTPNTTKIYRALITQSSDSPPTATILENTIGNIVWTYDTTGSYFGTLASAFTENKVFFSYQSRVSDDGGASVYDVFVFRLDQDSIRVTTFNSGIPTDGLLTAGMPLYLEIIVYGV